MGIEIERKFLVSGQGWRTDNPTLYRQGYLNLDKERTVRVRVAGETGYLTVKGVSRGATRLEYEYAIPGSDAEEMLELCEGALVEKLRHKVAHGDLIWEIDEFLGENAGLIVAEVEIPSEDHPVAVPPWAGGEVTGDPRYYNARLSQEPFVGW